LGIPTEIGADWCVAVQRIPAGLGGWVFISGVVLARLRDESSADMTVDIDPADDWWHLKQGASGAGKIIWLDTVPQSIDDSDPNTYRWALIRFPFGGGGGTSLQFVQTTGVGVDGVVPVKNISMKTDPALSPNYELTGSEYSINYFKD